MLSIIAIKTLMFDLHRGLLLVCARQEVEADRRVSIWPVTSTLPTAFGLRAFALGTPRLGTPLLAS